MTSLRITSFEGTVPDNRVLVDPEQSDMINSEIIFEGTGNILYIEDGVQLNDSKIVFAGNDALCYIRKSSRRISLKMDIWRECAVYIGQGINNNGKLNLVASERQNIIIGDDCLFSFGIWMRCADPHLIYDCTTRKRLNASKSILLGDHIWVGQDAKVLKGTIVGSGSLIGAGSIVSGKKMPSHTVFAGVPARMVKQNVFWGFESVHNWTRAKTKKMECYVDDCWIYDSKLRHDNSTMMKDGKFDRLSGAGRQNASLKDIDKAIKAKKSPEEKLAVIESLLVNNTDHDRFYMPFPKKKSLFRRILSRVKRLLKKIFVK